MNITRVIFNKYCLHLTQLITSVFHHKWVDFCFL